MSKHSVEVVTYGCPWCSSCLYQPVSSCAGACWLMCRWQRATGMQACHTRCKLRVPAAGASCRCKLSLRSLQGSASLKVDQKLVNLWASTWPVKAEHCPDRTLLLLCSCMHGIAFSNVWTGSGLHPGSLQGDTMVASRSR